MKKTFCDVCGTDSLSEGLSGDALALNKILEPREGCDRDCDSMMVKASFEVRRSGLEGYVNGDICGPCLGRALLYLAQSLLK